MARVGLVERRFAQFLRTPLSVRRAMAVIVSATVVSVVLGGVLITVVDREEYPDVGTGLWWALQTVTTVGYGDVVPKNGIGRVVGAIIMLESIAFVAIVTAAITSSFVERARRDQQRAASAAQAMDAEQLALQLVDLKAQLDRIEAAMERAAPR